jgi:hypothetical protein
MVGRRVRIVVVTSCVGLAPLALAGPVGAAKPPPVTAHGYSNCTMNGAVRYSPPLSSTPTSVTATVTAKLRCPGFASGPFDPMKTPPPYDPDKPWQGGFTDQRIAIEAGRLVATSTPYVGSCAQPHPARLDASIIWRPETGRAVGTSIVFGAATGGTAPISHRFQSVGVSGSFANETAIATISSPTTGAACTAKRLKRFKFTNAPLRFAGCGRNIPVTFWPMSDASGGPGYLDIWWLVVPNVTYEPGCHPTGTMSITFPNAPHCPTVTAGPLQLAPAQVVGFSFNPAPFWGRTTGLNTTEMLQTGCASARFVISYSGDATYQGFTRTFL